MAISDTQKVDYLWKKLGYSATKTDTNANKKAPNEAIASPLLMRFDTMWSQSSSIPSVLPGSSTGVVTVYPTSGPTECTVDATATANRTWKTGLLNWISPEFGSTYQVKVYIHTAGDAAGASGGDQVFATGSGNDDEWFFDYQSGVLHFIGTNLPNGISFTGKSVYISGGRYSGSIGTGLSATDFGELTTIGSPQTTITPIITNADIGLDPTGTGQVVITGDNAVTIPSGTTAARPSGTTGDLRVNTTTGYLEYYDGTEWQALNPDAGQNTALDTFTGDGSTTAFTLAGETTTNDVIVTIQGVVQQATVAYSVSGTTITFVEAPQLNEAIEVRTISSTISLSGKIADADDDTKIQVEEGTDEDKIRFDTAGSERMIITETGRVGIGLSNPADVLHIKNSDATIRLEDSADSSYIGTIIQSGNSLYVSAHTHRIRNEAGTEHIRITNGGDVGIGTVTPASKLDVVGTITADRLDGDVTGSVFADDSSLLVDGVNGNVPLAVEATNVTATANNTTDETVYITFVDGPTGTQGIETDTGLTYNPSSNTLTTTTFSGTATTAQYADLAEKYLCDQDYDEGTVVMVGGSAEVTACTEYSYAIGVVSNNPALMMNSELEGGTYIALKGRVPVKVQGPITKGQTLVAGDNGTAQAGTQGRVFAIALDSTDSNEIALLEAIIL